MGLDQHSTGRIIAMISLVLVMLFGLALWWRVNWLGYLVYVPDRIDVDPIPMIVILHGTGGDARTTRQWLGFDILADQYGFIALYPHSPDGQWDAGAGVQDRNTGERIRRDDTTYIIDIIEQVAARYPLDRDRIFLVGISDGAAMAYRLSCDKDGLFSALASVAATIPVYANRNCENAGPLSALFMHGKQDVILPWDGKTYRGITIYHSLEMSIDWWVTRNGCIRKDGDRQYQRYAGQVDRWIAQGCSNGSQIQVYRINDGGHSWPMKDHPRDRTQGRVNRDIDATHVIVEWMMSQYQ